MKKILSIVALMAIGLVNAQDIKSSKGEKYLPENGDWAIGFNADGIFQYVGNSFNGNAGNGAPEVNFVDNRVGTFVGKKFIADNQALRVIANLSFGANTTNLPSVFVNTPAVPNVLPVLPGTTESKTETTNETSISGFSLTAGLGKEWRRGKTRLQGFYGADVLLNLNSGSTTNTIVDTTTKTVKLDGPPASVSTSTTFASTETVNKTGFGFGVGVQGFLGAEYFLFPKISIGAQYTYGLNLQFNGKANITTTTASSGSPSVTDSTPGAGSTNINLGGVGITSLNMTLHF